MREAILKPLKHFILLIIGLSLHCRFISAQNYVDLMQVYYTNTPLNKFDSSLKETRVQDFAFNSVLPLKINDKSTFITGLDVEWMYASLTPTGSSGSAASIILKVGINHRFSDKWTTNFIVLPRLSSDFKNPNGGITREDFQLGGLLICKYTVRPNFKYKLGMYYNSELFGPFFAPIAGLYYKSPNQKFEADISLPFLIDVNYRFKPKVFCGFKFMAAARTYNLHNPYYSTTGEYLAKTSNEVYTYLGFEPTKGLLIKANIGYSLGRNYRLYDIHDKVAFGLINFRINDDRKQLNADFADGLLFKIDCVYRFYTN